jgi:hypothetical protein
MNRRSFTSDVSENVSRAIIAAGASPASVAEATDIPIEVLEERLSGVTPFQVTELADVGGFLHIRLSALFEGVSA